MSFRFPISLVIPRDSTIIAATRSPVIVQRQNTNHAIENKYT